MAKIRYAFLPLGAIIYFYISWFFPWEQIHSDSSISYSYVFDLLFSAAVFFIVKKSPVLGRWDKIKTLIRFVFITLFAFVCVGITKAALLATPFRYVDNLALQILFLAPFIEEFVFRGALYELAEIGDYSSKMKLAVNGLLFSFSHLSAIWFLSEEFHPFIYFQVLYTLILGWVCAKSREETKGMSEPIALHFVFNLLFYIAVKNYGL